MTLAILRRENRKIKENLGIIASLYPKGTILGHVH